MNVCMLSYSYYESDNRVRRYAETLAKRGEKVSIISIRQKDQLKKENISGVDVIRIQSRQKNEKSKYEYFFKVLFFLFNSFCYVTKHHIQSPYNLIHIHSVPDFEVFAALIPRLLGVKIILDIHDLVPEFYNDKFKSGKGSFVTGLLIKIEKLCCSFAHHVIISNDIWRSILISRSVESNKCTTVLNYPDESIFNRKGNRKSYSEGPFIIIYPGSLNYHQGLDIAVKAMKIVNGVAEQMQLHIYGNGPLVPKLKLLIEQLNLTNNVFLYNGLPLEKIADKIANAHLGIVPKRADGFGNEAFSTKIFEFMMMGIPVIASETKIDRYYFNDSLIEFFDSGDEKKLAEKIIYLFNNERRREELINNGLIYATENSWFNKQNIYFNIVDGLFGVKGAQGLEVVKQ